MLNTGNRMKILLFIMILLSTLISSSLEEMLKQLQTTPKEQRYKLVNNIKRELVKLNSEQRAQALKQLQKNLKVRHKYHIRENSQKTELKHQKGMMLNHHDMFDHKMQNHKDFKQSVDTVFDKDKGSQHKKHGR